jgi:VWFA-related protein
MYRYLTFALLSGLIAAQQQTAPPPKPAAPAQPAQAGAVAQDPMHKIVTSVENVVAPVIVFDRNGGTVAGIRPDQFHLFDNGREQNIQVDESFVPISMVIAIQTNAEVEKILPQVNKIGNLIKPLILGDLGEAAVLKFDSRVTKLQDFTNDPDKITKAVQNIFAGGNFAHLNDAVDESIRMLRSRQGNRRRILLLISETRDSGSAASARDDLIELQIRNVQVYQVTMSRLMGKLTAAPDVRYDTTPPAMRPMPSGVAATPTSVMQTYGTEGGSSEFIPLLMEIYRDAKAIFKSTPVQVFTKGTGGEEFPFYGGRGLEQAITRIGEQLHSEYTLTYNPLDATKAEGGWHRIEVTVTGHPEVPIKAGVKVRPGYWTATH